MVISNVTFPLRHPLELMKAKVHASTVERPTTPKEFATTVFSAVQDSDNLIPKNFALEVAPFWLGTEAQKNLTFNDYHNKERFGPDTWFQNFSISSDLRRQGSRRQQVCSS